MSEQGYSREALRFETLRKPRRHRRELTGVTRADDRADDRSGLTARERIRRRIARDTDERMALAAGATTPREAL